MSDHTITVTFDGVSEAQALTLEAMFEQWEQLGRIGRMEWVAFLVDGDGSFHPKIVTEHDARDLDDEIREAARASDTQFDFDAVAWLLRERDGEVPAGGGDGE